VPVINTIGDYLFISVDWHITDQLLITYCVLTRYFLPIINYFFLVFEAAQYSVTRNPV